MRNHNTAFITPITSIAPAPAPAQTSAPRSQHGPTRSSDLLSRVAVAIRRSNLPLHVPPQRPLAPPLHPPPSDDEWLYLVLEFERAASRPSISSSATFTPAPDTRSRYNPARNEYKPLIEASFMASLTSILWYFGRVLRLDAFLLLFYPLPTIYVAASGGLFFSNVSFCTALFLIMCLTGPWYTILFFCSSGLLALAYARCIWYRLSFVQTLAIGAAALGCGLVAQVSVFGFIMRENMWPAIVHTATGFMRTLSQFSARVPLLPTLPTLSAAQSQIAVIVLISAHSLYQVFCTLVFSSLVLHKIAETEKMVRLPPDFGLIRFVLRRSREQKRSVLELYEEKEETTR